MRNNAANEALFFAIELSRIDTIIQIKQNFGKINNFFLF